MEEKLLKEMISLLNDIREKLTLGQGLTVRGPVADPGPDFYRHWLHHRKIPFPIGDFGDPAPEFFLRKEDLAKIKVKELDIAITQITEFLDLTRMERDMLAKEYNIR